MYQTKKQFEAMANKNNDKQEKAQRSAFCRVNDAFAGFARHSSAILGSAWAFTVAISIIVVWGLTGPTFHFSDTWQLIINTGTTIVTFLMVFLIQNTQNRDAKAVHLKLDELIRALKGARNNLVDLEKMSDEDLKNLEQEFERIHQKAEHATHAAHKAEHAANAAEEAERAAAEAGRRR